MQYYGLSVSAEGFEEVEALTPADFLRRAGISVTTVGVGGSYITGSHGITVKADITEREAAERMWDTETMILPGGMPGTLNLDKSYVVHDFIEFCAENNRYIAAICAAPSIPGKMGILSGKKAICYPGYEDQLKGAVISDCGAVRDGNTICGRGLGSAAEFALLLISTLKGEAAADAVRGQILA